LVDVFRFGVFLQINHLDRADVESKLTFAGFLVFHCPLKEDAVESLKMLADSSHRVRLQFFALSISS
jgi:magnesium-transporting ATPase (P-type)